MCIRFNYHGMVRAKDWKPAANRGSVKQIAACPQWNKTCSRNKAALYLLMCISNIHRRVQKSKVQNGPYGLPAFALFIWLSLEDAHATCHCTCLQRGDRVSGAMGIRGECIVYFKILSCVYIVLVKNKWYTKVIQLLWTECLRPPRIYMLKPKSLM